MVFNFIINKYSICCLCLGGGKHYDEVTEFSSSDNEVDQSVYMDAHSGNSFLDTPKLKVSQPEDSETSNVGHLRERYYTLYTSERDISLKYIYLMSFVT